MDKRPIKECVVSTCGPRPAAPVLLGKLLEMQIMGPNPEVLNQSS